MGAALCRAAQGRGAGRAQDGARLAFERSSPELRAPAGRCAGHDFKEPAASCSTALPVAGSSLPLPLLDTVGIKAGDLVELHNENGATQGMAYPTDTARRGDVTMVFGSPAGSQGNIVNPGVNSLMLPEYKHCWADIRKISDAPTNVAGVSFKSKEYTS